MHRDRKSSSAALACGAAALIIFATGPLLFGQVSPEEHARHHPGQAEATPGGSPVKPAGAGPGMMEGMGEMMSGMGGTPPKQLYPTLMSLPTLSPEQRMQVEQKADERIRGGNSLMVEAVDALAGSAASQDYAAMHEATVKLHEGMTQLESGIAARQATVAPVTAKKWSGKLRVGRIFQETPDVKTFRLMNSLGGALPFTYLPGQFLTVAVAPAGQLMKRSYTIASSPTQHDYAEIVVKHEDEGIVSGFLHNHVKEGDLLDFSGPSGFFTFTGRECKCILLIGGGVGITPLMSVLRYLTDRSWPGDIFLLYCIKTPRDIIFREELDYLQRRNPNLRVVITVSRPEGTDWKGPIGRITKELIVQTVPDVASRYVHICGPVPMMEVAKKMLIELGVPSGRMKTEAFGPALGKPEPILPTVPTAPLLGSEISLPTVTFSVSDKSAPLPPDKVILDVADEIGVEIDNSCRVGTCGTCRVKLLSGQVTMAVEDGLEPGDKELRMILACQAKATANVEVEA